MELNPIQIFSAMNDKHKNLKECEGMIIKPVAYHTHGYTGRDGKEHHVLVIYNGNDKTFYKTEVQAFIEKFGTYIESFGNLPDEEKPEIAIVINTSQKGNKYVNFQLVNPE